ncbi:adenosylhomocysteinase [Demequina aestuarii]|uniref:adenosylhomocysteinase n=1 Tax=Demequina aestuarii TaxID=327095 RepID=UPI0007812FBD|nr:adenosylhomocysteinase [Demequina aestuarii]
MPDPSLEAERLLRRFARDTNLLIAGRPMRVHGGGPVADALVTMLTGMGARLGAADAPGAVTFDVGSGAIAVDGAPLPDRGDAAGRLDFAADHMPVTRTIADQLGDTVRGLRIGVSMTLEPKTANLALALAGAGATVAVYAHPDETDPEVAQALRERGVPVDADASLAPHEERAVAVGFLRRGFDVFVDDGSHLTRLAHEEGLTGAWIGATEETTSGLTPLRLMNTAGALHTPVIAVNDAATKTGFDNRYGTGQSCVLAIADLLDAADVTVRDQPALVIGYGPVGVGVAAHLRALGAEVRVAEANPVRALLAAHDGFETGAAGALAADALVVSATGVADTIPASMIRAARAVAVAGGVPGEIDLDGVGGPDALEPVAPHLERLTDTGTLVLDRGGCINVTAAEGNPIEIMDLSFATQLAAIDELATTRPGIGVHALSGAAVDRVAHAAARARGVHLAPPPASRADAADWRSPRYHAHPASAVPSKSPEDS